MSRVAELVNQLTAMGFEVYVSTSTTGWYIDVYPANGAGEGVFSECGSDPEPILARCVRLLSLARAIGGARAALPRQDWQRNEAHGLVLKSRGGEVLGTVREYGGDTWAWTLLGSGGAEGTQRRAQLAAEAALERWMP